jgi:hypothetical protein
MGKRVLLILGNGFSIDFLQHIQQGHTIDVRNLFRRGAEVPWPTSRRPGFLSFQHCPSLWNLGARCHCSNEESAALIEDILTCANAFATRRAQLSRTVTPGTKNNDIYIFAYHELTLYLRHLFIWYDQQVDLATITNISEWPWSKYLDSLYHSPTVEDVCIVTYNYDLWLERLLKTLRVPFCVEPFEHKSEKFTILKPHGSISFCHETKRERDAFAIPRNYDLLNGDARSFQVRYDELDENYLINPIIPPAGESGRFSQLWAGAIRNRCSDYTRSLRPDDEVLICGNSYWPVDRAELDELFNNADPLVSVRLLNPSPTRTFVAVLTSIFERLIAFTSSSALLER